MMVDPPTSGIHSAHTPNRFPSSRSAASDAAPSGGALRDVTANRPAAARHKEPAEMTGVA